MNYNTVYVGMDVHKESVSLGEISKKTGADPKTIRKYLSQEDFSPVPPLVQRYLKKCRSVQTEKANLELVWDPGPAQVDFGEADFYENGKLVRKKYLTVSFPYSNDGYSQVFGGETAECVCQGLLDIFEFIGGVPPLLIFDNATGVGRRIGDMIHETELFSLFRAHYLQMLSSITISCF